MSPHNKHKKPGILIKSWALVVAFYFIESINHWLEYDTLEFLFILLMIIFLSLITTTMAWFFGTRLLKIQSNINVFLVTLLVSFSLLKAIHFFNDYV